MKGAETVTIETERRILRNWQESDAGSSRESSAFWI